MIITRNWLNEWIDITEISTDKILKALNSIGLEVDSYKKFSVADKVVIGYVKSKKAHENSDHLSVCEVDTGSQSLQIVCGAKNVESGQFVAVSLIGAVLPNGLTIKPAKLRGVESNGMICSSSELGFPKLNDGIMVLDDSIGELVIGRNLNEYLAFNDELIDIDLTPNRGDCLSIYGIARDLSAALNIPLKNKNFTEEAEKLLGIGKILSVHADEKIDASFIYRAFEIKNRFDITLTHKLRLAFAEILSNDALVNLLNYTTHSTGVLLRAYDFNKITNKDKISIDIKKQENGELVVFCDDKLLGIAGINQNSDFKANKDSKICIVEANYTNPQIIAEALGENRKLKGDEHTYRSTRGSEPNLILGLNLLFSFLKNKDEFALFAGAQQILNTKEPKIVSFTNAEIDEMIGTKIEKNQILKILKSLEIDVNMENELITATIPTFRHDISNSHDICEEIVRIIGIDNIASKPLVFAENCRFNETFFDYENAKKIRYKSANVGFFECVHYIFDNEKELKNLGFVPCEVKILNPINAELSVLRPTLINHLLNSSNLNLRNSKKSIKLFEFGKIFDEKGVEKDCFGFIASGLKNEPSLLNSAKPENVDFLYFASLIQNIIGKFLCVLPDKNIKFLNDFEQAEIWQNGVKVGIIGRFKFENERDLAKTYVCEIDFKALKFNKINAKNYSKFPSISRDLSVVVPNNMRFEVIKNALNTLQISDLKEFLPVDIYKDENLKDSYSLTIKFTFQNLEKTLEDEQIEAKITQILKALNDLGLNLR